MFDLNEGLLHDELKYEDIVMVAIDCKYPILSGENRRAAKRINAFYRLFIKRLQKMARRKLLPGAIEEYRYSIGGGFPFRQYEAAVSYRITYHTGKLMSLYRDIYIYTGGAHGGAARHSETWNAATGWLRDLKDFFPEKAKIKKLLTGNATAIAERQMRAGTHQYFQNYRKLIKKKFSNDRYFLTGGGVSIFYDRDAIAPYSEGIPVFQYDTEPATATD